MRVSLLLILFVCIFTIDASGMMGNRMNYKWWKNHEIITELGLTDTQVKKIDNIFKSYKKRIVSTQKQLNGSEVKLKEALKNPDSTSEEILVITDQIEDYKAILSRIKVEMFLKVKDILSHEQIQNLHDIKTRYRQQRRSP